MYAAASRGPVSANTPKGSCFIVHHGAYDLAMNIRRSFNGVSTGLTRRWCESTLRRVLLGHPKLKNAPVYIEVGQHKPV